MSLLRLLIKKDHLCNRVRDSQNYIQSKNSRISSKFKLTRTREGRATLRGAKALTEAMIATITTTNSCILSCIVCRNGHPTRLLNSKGSEGRGTFLSGKNVRACPFPPSFANFLFPERDADHTIFITKCTNCQRFWYLRIEETSIEVSAEGYSVFILN